MTGPTRIVLVHGAWHDGSCWAPVTADLTSRGYRVDAPNMPSDESGNGAKEYSDVVLHAAGPGRDRVVLVGHSLGGLTVPVAAQRLGPARVAAIVMVAALTPVPGTSLIGRMSDGQRLMVPGYDDGVRRSGNGTTYWPEDAVRDGLYRGVADESSDEAVAAAAAGLRPQNWSIGKEITPLLSWPAVPTTAVVCASDRVADPDACREAAADVGADVVEIRGGHFPMLTRPAELAGVLATIAGPAVY